MLDDAELTRRSVLGLGEMLAALGRDHAGSQAMRRPDALGARIPAAAGNPWIDALGFGARLLAPVFARPLAWRVLDVAVALTMWALAAALAAGAGRRLV